ncbi:four-carbon acid sugar kinase family protein [Microvirga aerilata]
MVHIRQAAAKVLGRAPLAIVAPAFPEAGRATIDGHVFVNGTPLEDTEVWKQAGLTGPADLRMLLTQAGLKVELASHEQVALGSEALQTKLLNWLDAGCSAVVCDAQTEVDLLTVAAATLALPEKPLWVGSAGLMRALVRAGEAKTTSLSPPTRDGVEKPVLVVVGSASGASHMQFDALAQAADVSCLVIPSSNLRLDTGPSQVRADIQVLIDALACGSDAAVMIGNKEIDFSEGPQLATALADLIAPYLSQVGGLVVTGGETARAILVKAGISGLRMLGEIEPGVPVGLSIGEIAIPVITKAGAFGDSTTLIRCHAALRGGTSDHLIPASGG